MCTESCPTSSVAPADGFKAVKNSLSGAAVSPWRRLQLGRGPEPLPRPQRARPPFSAASRPPCPREGEDSCPTPFCIHEAGEREKKKEKDVSRLKSPRKP